jgi:hypothetical protein
VLGNPALEMVDRIQATYIGFADHFHRNSETSS